MEPRSEYENNPSLYSPIGGGQISLRRRLVIFAASAGVHGLFFLGCWLFFSPVEVIVDYRIENVILVSREGLSLPPGFSQVDSNSPETRTDVLVQTQSTSGEPDFPGSGLQTGIRSESDPGTAVESSAAGVRLDDFQLSIPPIETDKLSSDFSLEPLRPVPFAPRLKSTDLMRYLGPAGRGPALPSFPGGGGGGSGVVAIQGKTFNIKPWADRVLQEIQRNWFLSPENRDTFTGEVEIKVTVSRNGEILSSEVMRSSQSATLDEVALKALRVAPIPQLPPEFPMEKLEIRLVFQIQ